MNFYPRIGYLTLMKILLVFSMLLFAVWTDNANAVDCNVITKDLVADYGKIQERGGIWALFERSAALKDKSVLGMQLDSKLRRTVSIFETYCEDEPGKATVSLAKQIMALIDEGRILKNNNPKRVPTKKFIADVQSLTKKADQFITSLEK